MIKIFMGILIILSSFNIAESASLQELYYKENMAKLERENAKSNRLHQKSLRMAKDRREVARHNQKQQRESRSLQNKVRMQDSVNNYCKSVNRITKQVEKRIEKVKTRKLVKVTVTQNTKKINMHVLKARQHLYSKFANSGIEYRWTSQHPFDERVRLSENKISYSGSNVEFFINNTWKVYTYRVVCNITENVISSMSCLPL